MLMPEDREVSVGDHSQSSIVLYSSYNKFLDIHISCDIHTLVRAPNRGGMLGVRSNHARTYNYKFYEDFPVEIVGRGVCIAFSK
jgi:hypothetical protein